MSRYIHRDIRNRVQPFLGFFLILFVFVSCTEKSIVTPDPLIIEGKETWVSVGIHPISSGIQKTTKATSVDDSEIQKITALVFDNQDKLLYAARGAIKGINSFEFKLWSTASQIKICFIANADSEIDGDNISVGDAFLSIKRSLKMSSTAFSSTKVVPMVGELTLFGLSSSPSQNIGTIKLLRSFARADIIVDESPMKFKMKEVYIYRYNTFVQIIPTADLDWASPMVISPSVPASSMLSLERYKISEVPITYWSKLEGAIYLSESFSVPNVSDRLSKSTVLVVGGIYENDRTCYYRIDFDSGKSGHPYGQILRNYKYIFTIKSVSAPGWSDPDIAANNDPSGISVDVHPWDENTNDLTVDGSYFFGISSRNVQFSYRAGERITLPVTTNLSAYTAQWEEDPTTTITQGESFSNEYFHASLSSDFKSITIETLKQNFGASHNTKNLLIKVGSKNVPIVISQSWMRDDPLKGFNVLTIGDGLGHLGVYTPWANTAAEDRAKPMRNILTRIAYFGPSGIVKTSGCYIAKVDNPKDGLTKNVLELYNIVHIPEPISSTNAWGTNSAKVLLEWLDSKPGNFLFFNFDRKDHNVEILKALVPGISDLDIIYSTLQSQGITLPYSVSGYNHERAALIFKNGPFGEVDKNFTFRAFDVLHGEIRINEKSAHITPILMGAGGGIVLGIDFDRHVVYCGDVDLHNNGSGLTAGEFIPTDGTIGNNASKLMANIWAYMIRNSISN